MCNNRTDDADSGGLALDHIYSPLQPEQDNLGHNLGDTIEAGKEEVILTSQMRADLDAFIQLGESSQSANIVPVVVAPKSESVADERVFNDVQSDVAYGIQFVSVNVQKSAENMSQLLERFRDHDVICVQEPYWGHIKNVPSSRSKDGDSYENTVSHRSFLCLGAGPAKRVCTFVHR